MMTLIYVFGAILAINFLVFIHELGHYWMARREGMRVETFSIGFGTPIVSWMFRGVKWQIGWILFGGYVKIAGMEGEEDDPYLVRDGFFGKSPWARIKVLLMGPFTNILFALLAFGLLYASGGRLKSFSEYTEVVGWVDPKSDLYKEGIRPGDLVYSYNDKAYRGVSDLLYLGISKAEEAQVKGAKIQKGALEPFSVTAKFYPDPTRRDKNLKTLGVLQPASFMIYDRLPNGEENPLPKGSPMEESGLQYGDRLLWADGHIVYSPLQLSNLLNDARILLTVSRNDKTILVRVPRIDASELRLDVDMKEELNDWKHTFSEESKENKTLYTIPYNLTNDAVVENSVKLIDRDRQNEVFPEISFSEMEMPLQTGDRILAVAGVPVKNAAELLRQLQKHHAVIIVERLKEKIPLTTSLDADVLFERQLHRDELQRLAGTIGLRAPLLSTNNLVVLKPVEPKTLGEIFSASVASNALAEAFLKQKQQIQQIDDKTQREQLLKELNDKERQFALGIPQLRDLKVQYNPVPTEQFMTVFNDTFRTLYLLVTGSLSPKLLSGPVGIVYIFQEQSRTGLGDALFWLGLISLNLGIFNLLPIPMLDGGNILFCLWELITGKKIAPKTMQNLILPFALLLIGCFIYWTFNDILRIFERLTG